MHNLREGRIRRQALFKADMSVIKPLLNRSKLEVSLLVVGRVIASVLVVNAVFASIFRLDVASLDGRFETIKFAYFVLLPGMLLIPIAVFSGIRLIFRTINISSQSVVNSTMRPYDNLLTISHIKPTDVLISRWALVSNVLWKSYISVSVLIFGMAVWIARDVPRVQLYYFSSQNTFTFDVGTVAPSSPIGLAPLVVLLLGLVVILLGGFLKLAVLVALGIVFIGTERRNAVRIVIPFCVLFLLLSLIAVLASNHTDLARSNNELFPYAWGTSRQIIEGGMTLFFAFEPNFRPAVELIRYGFDYAVASVCLSTGLMVFLICVLSLLSWWVLRRKFI